MSHHSPTAWLIFSLAVVIMMAVDLGVLNRRSHVLSVREAALQSGVWVTLALLFGLYLFAAEGIHHAAEYYTGYIIELSLSVDNLFVFILILQYFAVPPALQPRVLKWGILGAIIMRALMIGLGAVLLARFDWVIYFFGAIVIFTGWKMLRTEDIRVEPERNPVVRLAQRALPLQPPPGTASGSSPGSTPAGTPRRWCWSWS